MNRTCEVGLPGHVRIDSSRKQLAVPGMGKDYRKLVRTCQRSQRVRSKEIEIDQAAEEILPPAMAIKEKRVPAGLLHEIQKLSAPFRVQHQRRIATKGRKENGDVAISLSENR